MIPVSHAFSSSYAQARERFLAACGAAGLTVDSRAHPLPGRDGEPLAMDVALDGPADARALLLVSSACHGIEGYCGSGVQVFALHDEDWRRTAREAGVAVLYVHALNPHGFSHGRRVTQENVDLNRNFIDFGQSPPVNEGYVSLHPLLLPAEWPPGPGNQRAIEEWIARHGLPAYQQAVSGGQYQFPDGLFFGGQAPTWSNTTLRSVLRRHAGAARRLAWIDLHTGLGPSGVGERIFAARNDPAAYRRACDWWSRGGGKMTSIYDGSSTSAFLTGLMCEAAYQECPQAEYTGMALEYGTLPILEVTGALRADHWLHAHPEADAALAARIRADMRTAFYTDTDAWRDQVIAQAREALAQAVEGLAA